MARARQINIRLNLARCERLDRMAEEAKTTVTALAKSMLEHLIDDDAKAHGKESKS